MAYRKEISDAFDDDFEVTYEEDIDNWGYEEDTGNYGTDFRRPARRNHSRYDTDDIDVIPRKDSSGYDRDDYDTAPRRVSSRYDDSDYDGRPSRRKGNKRRKHSVPLAAPIRKGGRVLSRAAAALVRCLTAVIILATTAYVTYTFWRASTPYGDVQEAVRTGHLTMTLAAYLSIAAIFILFEFIALLWSMTRTRVRDEAGSWKEDTGRGLSSFVFIFGTSYLSFILYRFIPGTPEILFGLKGALDVYGSMHNVLLGLCAAGVASCLVRKYF